MRSNCGKDESRNNSHDPMRDRDLGRSDTVTAEKKPRPPPIIGRAGRTSHGMP
jgi:hypothetical protein